MSVRTCAMCARVALKFGAFAAATPLGVDGDPDPSASFASGEFVLLRNDIPEFEASKLGSWMALVLSACGRKNELASPGLKNAERLLAGPGPPSMPSALVPPIVPTLVFDAGIPKLDCQFSPASLANSFSSIFSLLFARSSSAMHRSFSRWVPERRSSRFLYSRSRAWTWSSGGRWRSWSWRARIWAWN